MITKRLAGQAWLFLMLVHMGFGQPKPTAQDLLIQFNTTDGLSRAVALGKFDQAYPPGQRAAILAQVWSLAAKLPAHPDAQLTVLGYAASRSDQELPLNNQLQAAIADAAKKDDVEYRRLALHAAARHYSPQLRPVLTNLLTVPDDEFRQEVLVEANRLPDGPALLQEYVNKNQGASEWAASVAKARAFLERRRK